MTNEEESKKKKTSTVLKKDRTVRVETKAGGSYSYSYSTLAEIHRYLEETGQQYEAYIKKVEGDDYMFIRKLSKDQETLVDLQCAKIPPSTGVQDYGGVLTSVRCFSLLMAFGLACEEQLPPPTATNSPAAEARTKWRKMHTPNPSKPASEKQIAAISRLCEDLKIPANEALQKYIGPARDNQAAASDIISQLIKQKERKIND